MKKHVQNKHAQNDINAEVHGLIVCIVGVLSKLLLVILQHSACTIYNQLNSFPAGLSNPDEDVSADLSRFSLSAKEGYLTYNAST